jgi:hypothetical protein
VKVGADLLAYGTVGAVLAKWLPVWAAGLSVLWLTIQIADYVMKKLRCWREKKNNK